MKRIFLQVLPLAIYSIVLVTITLFSSQTVPVAKAQTIASPDFNAIDAYVGSE